MSNSEDIDKFNHDGNIFVVLLLCTMVLVVPLTVFMGYFGFAIWGVIAIAANYYGFKVDKQKKNFDIQTYKEILAFSEGKSMDEIQKQQEYGKRPYQKIFIVAGVSVITLAISAIMLYILS